ncbi:hypothetical protein [Pelagibacterium halotolerans]|uniref:hypothetical protein n=1 Tax=Pelagibacterium halotolerans TaxID=531813 RepID=UPI00384D5169
MGAVILQALGVLASVGATGFVLVTVAYWFFKLFAEKWLDAKFKRQLTELEHAKLQELEHIKFEVAKLLDRNVKLNEREFELLPDLWEKAIDAHAVTQSSLSPFQRYAVLRKMNATQIEEHFQELGLQKWEREKILSSGDVDQEYQRVMTARRIDAARSAARDFEIARRRFGIFAQSDIDDALKNLADLLFDAIFEAELEFEHEKDYRERDARKRLNDDGGRILDGLQGLIRDRMNG